MIKKNPPNNNGPATTTNNGNVNNNNSNVTSVYVIAIPDLFQYLDTPYLSLHVNDEVFSKVIESKKEIQNLIFPVSFNKSATVYISDATGYRLFSNSLPLETQNECVHVEGITPRNARSITIRKCTNIRPSETLVNNLTVNVNDIDVKSVKHEICSTIYLTDGTIRRTCHLLNPEDGKNLQQDIPYTPQPCNTEACVNKTDCLQYCATPYVDCINGCCTCLPYPSQSQKTISLQSVDEISPSWRADNSAIYSKLLR